MLTRLNEWDIIALAGLCALGYLAVSSTIGFTLAWVLYRERVPASVPAVAPKSAIQPAPMPEPVAGVRVRVAPSHETPVCSKSYW